MNPETSGNYRAFLYLSVLISNKRECKASFIFFQFEKTAPSPHFIIKSVSIRLFYNFSTFFPYSTCIIAARKLPITFLSVFLTVCPKVNMNEYMSCNGYPVDHRLHSDVSYILHKMLLYFHESRYWFFIFFALLSSWWNPLHKIFLCFYHHFIILHLSCQYTLTYFQSKHMNGERVLFLSLFGKFINYIYHLVIV